jgi:hypothetical protein
MAHYSTVSGPAPGGVSSPTGSGGEAFEAREAARDLAGALAGSLASNRVLPENTLEVALTADGLLVALVADGLVVAFAGDFWALVTAGFRVVEVFRVEAAGFLAARAGFAAAESVTASAPVAVAAEPVFREALAACFSRYSALVGQ